MGASLALAGLTGCTRQPTELIMPYVRQPEELIPGRPLFFATAMPLSGVATGVLVESHEGRPTKIEGNPEHPASLGACDVYSQASVLGLYDPDRSQALTLEGEIRSWGAFPGRLREALAAAEAQERRGHAHSDRDGHVAHAGGPVRGDARSCIPAAKWHQWEPAGPHSARAGARLAFGEPVNTYYDLSERQRDRVAGFAISWPRARAACATRGSSRRGGACAAARPT